MKHDRFAEILYRQIENQVRQDLSKNFSQPAGFASAIQSFHEDLTPSCLSQLVGAVGKVGQNFHGKAQVYHQNRPKVQRKVHTLSQAQLKAVALFLRLGQDIGQAFNLKELKAAFRTLALKTHPDQGGENQIFIELKEAFKLLKPLVAPAYCNGR